MRVDGPPVFSRSPRLKAEPPQGEVEIPAPPPAPMPPHVSLMSVAFSLLPGLLGALIMYLFARSSGAQATSYVFYSLPMLAIGALIQAGLQYQQKERYRRELQAREHKYAALIQRYARDLERLRAEQEKALRQTDPEPAECLRRIEHRDARMWDRSPQDPDFLAVRLGSGCLPFSVSVKVPRPDRAIDPDPLFLQAQDLALRHAQVDGVPIRLPLRDAGIAGVVGARPAVLSTVRSLALHVATHHAPDEVKIAAVFPAEEAGEWAWLRWLPHVWTDGRKVRLLAAEREGAHALCTDLYDLLSRRKAQAAMRSKDGPDRWPLPALVLILGDLRLAENEALLPLLLREGPALGAFPVFLADRTELLPKECRAIVEVASAAGQLIVTAPARSRAAFAADQTAPALAEQAARAMAPLRLHEVDEAGGIPAQVALLDLLGVQQVADLDVLGRWRASEPHRSLAVPVGLRAGGERLLLDLHERGHGPHGLVAGATGSGKSELLQTLVAALAVAFHPHEVAFVMVDYKGGGMANAFKDLPHLAGTITNLEGTLARRALAALRAELKRRQKLLGDAGVNHIDEYIRARRQGHRLEPLPHLIVVIDEFAELKADQPEFIRELISAVRVGRSLGVHLILATQKPAGVVDEQIWSNTRFRLCLRVERPQDSQEVLKCPDAASITGAGRAYFQVGNNERFELFQAGWGGAPYAPGVAGDGDGIEIAEVALNGRRFPLYRSPGRAGAQAIHTQLQAVVGHLSAAARAAGIKPLSGPWLPPLPEQVCLEQLRHHGSADAWLEPVVGLVDDPEHQRQEPLRINLGQEGHLAVYGAPGTGKTTFLQTLVTALALAATPRDLHLYLVDGSGRALSLFTPLPHVGAVVQGDEAERVRRLLVYLLQEAERRKELFAAAGVNTLGAYRRTGRDPLPALVVVLDNYPVFASTYPAEEEMLAQVAREGGSLGIHLVLTASSPAAVRTRLATSITMAVALQLADRGEYGSAVGRTGGLEPAPLPGRGLVRGAPPLEFQTALPVAGKTEWERSAALKALIREMASAWTGPLPPPVKALPDVVPLCEVLPPGEGRAPGGGDPAPAVPVGLEVESLAPFALDLQEGPHFVIAGPVECGKTTFLQAWLLALAERLPPERLHLWLVDMGAGGLAPLKRLPHVRAHVTDGGRLGEALDQVAAALQERRQALDEARRQEDGLVDERGVIGRFPTLVMAVDDFDALRDGAQSGVKERLEQMIRRERGMGFHVLAAGSSTVFSQGYEGLIKALKELQTGFVLGSSEHGDLSLLNLRLPSGETGKLLPPGLGFYGRRGRLRRIKAATPHAGAVTLSAWVERLLRRGNTSDPDPGASGGAAGDQPAAVAGRR